MGVVVAFPFAAINILPQSCMSDIIQKDSIENGVNREGFFSATKTFIEKIEYSKSKRNTRWNKSLDDMQLKIYLKI